MLNTTGQIDSRAATELLSLIYEELRRLAAARMASEAPGQTLQPTALVHEAWLRLTKDEKREWNDRTYFFAAADEAMRRILVDNARRKRTERHGDGQQRVEMPEIASAVMENDDMVRAVNDVLEKFAALDPQKSRTGEAAVVRGHDDRASGGSARHFRWHRVSALSLHPSLARPANQRGGKVGQRVSPVSGAVRPACPGEGEKGRRGGKRANVSAAGVTLQIGYDSGLVKIAGTTSTGEDVFSALLSALK